MGTVPQARKDLGPAAGSARPTARQHPAPRPEH